MTLKERIKSAGVTNIQIAKVASIDVAHLSRFLSDKKPIGEKTLEIINLYICDIEKINEKYLQ